MKYDDKYPNAPKWFSPEHDAIMKGTQFKPCYNCKELTDWIDLCFESHMCSEECSKIKWSEYTEACKNYNPT
jgi:hypothetical protein